jgi:hypothetical protein
MKSTPSIQYIQCAVHIHTHPTHDPIVSVLFGLSVRFFGSVRLDGSPLQTVESVDPYIEISISAIGRLCSSGRICLCVVCPSSVFFGSGPPLRTDRLHSCDELKLNWNSWLVIHPWHSAFALMFHFGEEGKMTPFSRRSVRTFSSILAEVLGSKPGFNSLSFFCIFLKKQKKKIIPYGRTFRYRHCICIALRHYIFITCITCIALRCIACDTLAITNCCIALHSRWLNVMLMVRHVCSWIVPSVV